MLILVKDNLLHVDSSIDILEHHGVKGMKWGKRLRSAVESVKQAPKNIYNNHVENIKYSYRKKGYSEAEVEAKTKKRLRNEKIAAAVAATALAAYGANKGAAAAGAINAVKNPATYGIAAAAASYRHYRNTKNGTKNADTSRR